MEDKQHNVSIARRYRNTNVSLVLDLDSHALRTCCNLSKVLLSLFDVLFHQRNFCGVVPTATVFIATQRQEACEERQHLCSKRSSSEALRTHVDVDVKPQLKRHGAGTVHNVKRGLLGVACCVCRIRASPLCWICWSCLVQPFVCCCVVCCCCAS